MTDFLLSPTEIKTLTDRTRRDAQVRMLRFMGIEHKVRSDGTLVVSRSHVEAVLGGAVASAKLKKTEPDWKTLKGGISCV